jgi:hypothetical protein
MAGLSSIRAPQSNNFDSRQRQSSSFLRNRLAICLPDRGAERPARSDATLTFK